MNNETRILRPPICFKKIQVSPVPGINIASEPFPPLMRQRVSDHHIPLTFVTTTAMMTIAMMMRTKCGAQREDFDVRAVLFFLFQMKRGIKKRELKNPARFLSWYGRLSFPRLRDHYCDHDHDDNDKNCPPRPPIKGYNPGYSKRMVKRCRDKGSQERPPKSRKKKLNYKRKGKGWEEMNVEKKLRKKRLLRVHLRTINKHHHFLRLLERAFSTACPICSCAWSTFVWISSPRWSMTSTMVSCSSTSCSIWLNRSASSMIVFSIR